MAFKTSETVTVSELLAPGSCRGSLKSSETLTKRYETVPFRKKKPKLPVVFPKR